MKDIKIGLSCWNKEAPKIIYRIGDTLYSIAIALSTYSLVGGQQWAIKLGAGCLIVGILLERISGYKELPKSIVEIPKNNITITK